MNLKILSVGEMVAVGHGLLVEQRDLVDDVPAVAWLMPQLKAVHEVLVRLDKMSRAQAGATSLSVELKGVDIQHDECVRAIHGGLTAYAHWLRAHDPSDPQIAAVLGLRDKLFPDGLAVINLTYLEEAGMAMHILSRMDAADRALAARIPFYGSNLMEGLHHLERVGGRLEALVRKRALLMEAPKEMPSPWAAKNEWVGVIKLLLENLGRSGAPPMTQERLRQPIIAASQAAVARAKLRDAKEEPLADDAAPPPPNAQPVEPEALVEPMPLPVATP